MKPRSKPIKVASAELASHNLADGAAGSFRAGVVVGVRQQMFRLGPTTDEFVTAPVPVLVTMSYQMSSTIWNGSFDVVAELVFSAGLCSQRLELDVPAGGTAISVVGPDGLELIMRAEGTSPDGNADFRAAIAYLRNSHPRAAWRTLLWEMPGHSTVIQAIPRFARGYQLASTVPLRLPATTVEVLASPVLAAARVISSVVAAEGTFFALPLGAESMRLTSAGAHTVRAIFELQP